MSGSPLYTLSSLGTVTWSTSANPGFRKKVRQLKRFKYLPTRKKLLQQYCPYYCILVWGTSIPSLMNKLEHIHARAAKTIHRPPWDILDGTH